MNGQLREHGSLSESSNSRYDALEQDDTDDSFGRRMIQEMNQDRVLSEGRKPQAFRKARIHPRGGLTLENLERVAPSNETHPTIPSHSSLGSLSSGFSDPSLNVPREWGRKGRRNNDWLRRIRMDSPKITERDGKLQEHDWATAAVNVPLPSLEDSPSSRRASTRGTPAASVRGQQASVERDEDWELASDLNAASFIESTPMPGRNTALEEIRQREFEEALNESSVYRTTTTYPTPPPGPSSPRRSKSPASQSLADTWSHPAEQELAIPKRTERAKPATDSITRATTHSRTTSRNGPPSPIALHKSPHTLGGVDRAVTPQAQISPQRPVHRREDSQVILRRLARASSNTPSPGNAPNRRVVQEETPALVRHRPSSASAVPPVTDSGQSPKRSLPRPQTSSVMQTKTVAMVQETREEQVVQKETHQVSATPVPPTRQLNSKTPVVTGAWIDTPKPVISYPSTLHEPVPSSSSHTSRPASSKEVGSSERSALPAKKAAQAAVQRVQQDNPSQVQLESQSAQATARRPSFPSSALSAVIDEARHHQGTDSNELLGEATIESLEDLMSPHEDQSAQEEDTLDQLELPTREPKSAAEKSRMAELLTLKSMNQKLKATKSSIRSVNHGIQGLQKQMHDSGDKVEVKKKEQQVQTTSSEVYLRSFSDLGKLLRTCLYTQDEDGKIKLGPLGLFLTLFFSWLLTEVLMCHLFCRPAYASSMSGFGVDPDAPEFPFTLPTMLLRPLRPVWRPCLNTATTFAHLVWDGVTDFFNQEPATGGEKIVKNVIEEVVIDPGNPEDWDMMNDDILY
ncbi:Galactokinase [Venturia nashicola]|uniref:Galactokinase n=1 Tax=Venturia nashicola TaxID=86259 RepID=A0A4Z1PR45_9PEZI|nr:Galactokinase [Venturia nashicola]TLD37406.1 Galactokinase [Venturia nashicola]